ncbi:MAG: hypothetical protein MUC57_20140 [Desulfobacterales bacterium]|nr:hypothetical protein [Desulfobacterales bacterium]
MPKIKLDHCVIHVSDWDRSHAFYRDVLGAATTPVARLPVQPGGSDLCFEWPGPIREAQAHLEAYGVPIELGPVPRFGACGQGTSIYFRDPDGSLLEFISYKRSHPVSKMRGVATVRMTTDEITALTREES